MTSVSVFVTNNTYIDFDVFGHWLNGLTVHEAVQARFQSGILQTTGASPDVLQSDTLDNYRTFSLLERFLQAPPKLATQVLLQIPAAVQRKLIEKYYDFDSEVIREILGKKLTNRHRKDVDDVSERTNIRLRSCRRQVTKSCLEISKEKVQKVLMIVKRALLTKLFLLRFLQYDNCKNIFKTVEDMEGSLVNNISVHFLLPEKLAKKYAAIVFFSNNRFETGKKKLQYLSFDDFAYCADLMIHNWTFGAAGKSKLHSLKNSQADDMDVEMDRVFLQELRDLKVLTGDKDVYEKHRGLVCSALRGKIPDPTYADIESNFKNLSRCIVSVASGLIHSKELKDFFVDLVEKFIEPCKNARWSKRDVEAFLKAYEAAIQQIPQLKRFQPHLLIVWTRYMTTLKKCILQLYHS
ncbi:FIBP [Branchiostoma lanceolatum]|uniref:FIBP protein n=1 Tax=Branchiostoma lanceolatum TaxID=7740 RepID=A0A8J9ZQP6_BRALA|nr:FIBP [Branchiostoma lanceolatum]